MNIINIILMGSLSIHHIIINIISYVMFVGNVNFACILSKVILKRKCYFNDVMKDDFPFFIRTNKLLCSICKCCSIGHARRSDILQHYIFINN